MAVKLRIGEPVLVAMGPAMKDVGWGTHQFPDLRRLPDGRIVMSYSVVADMCSEHGKERGWAVSEDEGATWRDVPDSEIPEIKKFFGTKLPSGKYLKEVSLRPLLVEEGYYKKFPRHRAGRTFIDPVYSVPAEDVPDGLIAKTWTYQLSDPATGEVTQYECDLDFPGMTIHMLESAICRPCPSASPRVAPDGTLWQVTYAWGRNPKNLGMTAPYYACYYFQSLDEGKSFKLKSWIQYVPDTEEFPNAFSVEGFCEPDLAFMPDGSMITLLRTGGGPSYLARSTDGGNSWAKPEKFDFCGVLPQLEVLGCGVTLATYGRPGLYVRATEDPAGLQWEDPVTLIPYNGEPGWCDSCCYTHLLPLDDRTVLLAYSNFRVKDEAGVDRKCMMVRTIHVD